MGMGSRMITSSSYWMSSDSDDDNYNITPIQTSMARTRKQKMSPKKRRPLNAWQSFIRDNYEKVRTVMSHVDRFKNLSKMYNKKK
jgi:hypothetical protein